MSNSMFDQMADARAAERVRSDNARNASVRGTASAPLPTADLLARKNTPADPTITLPNALIDDPNSFTSHHIELTIDKARQLSTWLIVVLDQVQ